MAIMHRIKAYLYENLLTEDPHSYIARVDNERSLSIAEICQSATGRGGADASAAAMEHTVRLFLKEMAYQLYDGYAVNTEYFTASAQIKGVFNSPTEAFSHKKHTIQFQFAQGASMRSELGNIEVQVLGLAETGISIVEAIDVKSGSVNGLLTPGRILRIKGSKLKLAGTHEAVGVYLVSQSSGQRFKIDTSDIVTNKPSELIVLIPELEAGQYQLEITSQFTTGNLLKEPRSSSFDKLLTVL